MDHNRYVNLHFTADPAKLTAFLFQIEGLKNELIMQEDDLKRWEEDLDKRQHELNIREDYLNRREHDLDRREQELNRRQDELNDANKVLFQVNHFNGAVHIPYYPIR